MKLRGSRLVAVLFPVAVAIVPVSLLIWYDVRRIPSREEYLNQRNLRLLTTLGGAVKAKVESFDGALDNTVKSFPLDGPGDPQKRFRQRFALFAPDLEITKVRVTKGDGTIPKETRGDEIDNDMLADADDPPVIRVRRDESRYYLYVGAKLEDADRGATVWISARANLNTVLAPLLDRNQDFAAVMVATDSGEVIAQNSRVGLTLSRLTGLGPSSEASKDLKPLSTLASSGGLAAVTIGGVSYKQYVQSIPLSLLNPTKSSDDDSRHPEEWFVCGLVLDEQFMSESAALSFTTLLWFSGFLAIITISLPFVKLRALNARERLRAADTRLATAMSMMGIGLLTFAVLGGLTFGWWFKRTVDARLQTISDRIAANVNAEIGDIDGQGDAFDAYLAKEHIFSQVSEALRKKELLFPWMDISPRGDRIVCNPPDACVTGLLGPETAGQPKIPIGLYPFFDLVTWAGADGWQRVRWTPGANIRPFLNIFDEMLPYAQSARATLQAGADARGVDVVSSPTTGDPLTVFWRATSDSEGHADRIQSLAMKTLVSLDRTVLPKGVSFAVAGKDGGVLFHTTDNRRLQENFLTECEDDIRLRALLQDTRGNGGTLNVLYRGRDQRLRVQPLKISHLHGKDDPGWQLVVFQDAAIGDTLNLETLTIAAALFAMYLGLLVIIGTVVYVFAPWQRKWFWPDPEKRAAYRAVALVNAGAAAIFVVLLTIGTLRKEPDLILVATTALALGMMAATYRIVVRSPSQRGCRDPFTWQHPFFAARAVFMLVVAALPAIASFNVAYWFETALLTNLETVQQAADVADRSGQFTARAAQVAHAPHGLQDPGTQLEGYISANTHPPLWFAPQAPARDPQKSASPPLSAVGSRWFTWLLGGIHRPYNDTAGALASSVSTDPAAPQAASPLLDDERPITVLAGGLLAIIAALFAACFAFVFWLVKPMFALDAVEPRLVAPADALSGRILQVGPFGSGKSTNLALAPARQIIDIAVSGTTASVRAAATGAAVAGVAAIDVSAMAVDPVTDVPELGIDHVDYRIEDPEFGGQTLTLIERVMSGDCSDVRIVCDRDPLVCLQDSGAPATYIDRWVRALRSCRKEIVRVDGSTGARETPPQPDRRTAAQAVLDECCGIPALESIGRDLLPAVQSTGVDEALASFGVAASPYYESLWRGCTEDERLTLRQLAEEEVVNPQNQAVVRNLMATGLIARDPIARIVNSTFRGFVIQAASAEQVSAWERRGIVIPWSSIELALLSVVIILAVLLVGTQRQLINAWVGIIPALLPAGQRAFTSIAALWPGSKAGSLA